MQNIKPYLIAALFGLLFSTIAEGQPADATQTTAANKEDVIIQGVTDFLKDRATANFLYTFEKEIMEEESHLECYLPTLKKTLVNVNLDELSQYDSKAWKKLIGDDIQNDVTTLIIKKLSFDVGDSKWEKNITPYVLYAIQEASKDEYGELNAPIEKKLQTKLTTWLKRVALVSNSANDNTCKIFSLPDNKNLNTEINKLIESISSMDPDHDSKDKYRIEDAPKQKATIDIFIDLAQDFVEGEPKSRKGLYKNSLLAIDRLISEFKNSLESKKTEAEKKKTAKEAETRLLYIIPYRTDQDKEILASLSENIKEYEQQIPNTASIRYMRFFASLADAQSATDVKTTLSNFALPAISYGEKRKKNRVFISSYVGVGSGRVIDQGDGNTFRTGLYVPIGIEFPLGGLFGWPNKHWGPISLMLAPFDFGYPLSQKLYATSKSFTTSDIISPSIAISYGVLNLPINWGFVYQTTKGNISTSKMGERVMCFVSFDMPLYALH